MSQIKIYKTEITPDRNARVDDINAYLALCPISYQTDKLQYQKIELDLSIKLPIPQEDRFKLGNYVCINQDGKDWYFFLLSANWTSKKAVRINLSLDSVNTFANDLVFNDKTTIVREHRDRFSHVKAPHTLLRVVDKVPEGIVSNKIALEDAKTISEPGKTGLDWYLLYQTAEDLTPDNIKNPVSCYLMANQFLYVKSEKSSVSFSKQDFRPMIKTYYLRKSKNPNYELSIPTRAVPVSDKYHQKGDPVVLPSTYKPGVRVVVEWFWDVNRQTYTNIYTESLIDMSWQLNKDGHLEIRCKTAGDRQYMSDRPKLTCPNHFILIEDNNSTMKMGKSVSWLQYSLDSSDLDIEDSKLKDFHTLYQNTVLDPIYGIDTTDKADSKLMKIVRLPYAPGKFAYQGATGYYDFTDIWEYEQPGRLKLRNVSYEFENPDFARVKLSKMSTSGSVSVDSPRSIQNESKLYHSDFYTYKLVYDTFIKQIRFEDIEFKGQSFSDGYAPEFKISFKPTNTINSKSAFYIHPGDYLSYHTTEDYEKYLLTSRNNEETIFNNSYVNYIRNGYNYDKKQHAISIWQQSLGLAVQALSAGASFGLGGFVGNQTTRAQYNQGLAQLQSEKFDRLERVAGYGKEFHIPSIREHLYQTNVDLANEAYNSGLAALDAQKNASGFAGGAIPFAQGISTATGFITSIFELFFSQANFNNQMNSKLAQLSAQSTSTSGTDDSDLLKYYNDNKLQEIVYYTEPLQRQALYNLFFYCGYAHPAQEIPETNSRWWFNYIQCEPVFENEATTPYWEFLNDVKTRYSKGITIYHHRRGEWDFAQDKENWETFLVE